MSTFDLIAKRTINYKYINHTYKNTLKINKFDIYQKQYQGIYPIYHQDKLHGFFNLTTVFQKPILVSQNHQFNVQPKVSKRFEYFDKDKNKITPSIENDGNFYEAEEITGFVVKSRNNYHINLEIKPSLLMIGLEDELNAVSINDGEFYIAPLYNLEISKNISDGDMNMFFKNILFMNEFFKVYFYIFAISTLVLFGLVVLFSYCLIKERKRDYNKIDDEDDPKFRLIGHENMYMEF